MAKIDTEKLLDDLLKIKGGYEYMGSWARQLCFPLVSGGELRFMIDDNNKFSIDLYSGKLDPWITGPSKETGIKSIGG